MKITKPLEYKTATHRFGWIPQFPDKRDRVFPSAKAPLALPPVFSLKKNMPSVYDQGQLGSCTANASCAAFAYTLKFETKKRAFTPSRLFVYYNARLLEGTQNTDSGAMIRDAVKALSKYGVAQESLQPYDISKFSQVPSDKAYQNGVSYNHVALAYQAVERDIAAFKLALSQNMPVIIGFSVYESFESGSWTSVMPIPKSSESLLGGHAVLIIGWDDSKQAFLVRNSWGKSWKMQGYFYMPYAYIMDYNLSSDFWVISKIG